ncbi:MAG TPA: hypothetical protein VGG02_11925 [Chthoniobacterales bacterium]|jgi:hypothetical protein
MTTPILDRYLTAVKFWLPKKQRADIAAELAANLQAEIDDRAAALGRPLSTDEVAALLKEHGAPIVVASRYQPQSRTLTFGRQIIGPLLFPFYWTALKVTLVLLLVPGVIPAFVLNFDGHPGEALRDALTRGAQVSLPVLLLVTIAFALLDLALRKYRLLERWSGRWDPRRLPSPERQAKQVRRSNSIAGVILQSIFILWWLGHSSFPFFVINQHGAQIHFVPMWTSLHFPILILSFVCLAQHWINLAQPGWRWLPPLTGILVCLGSLFVLYPLMKTTPLIAIPAGAGVSAQAAVHLNQIVAVGLEWAWIGIIACGAFHVWRLVWIAWQSMPPTENGARSNGIVHT